MRGWTIRPEPVSGAEVGDAIREFFAEAGRRLLGREATDAEVRAALAKDPHDSLCPPDGVFLSARDAHGTLAGYVGVRLLPDLPATAELKRLYVRPAGRGAGLGRELLVAAEDAARELGAITMVLETNSDLTEARAMYAKHGYRETEPYPGHGAAEHWYAKDL
jgi:GNAT superfamily N-acetyltransferase